MGFFTWFQNLREGASPPSQPPLPSKSQEAESEKATTEASTSQVPSGEDEQLVQARENFLKASQLVPDHTRHNEALQLFHQVLEVPQFQPHHPVPWAQAHGSCGFIERMQGNFQKSVVHYMQAVEVKGLSPTSLTAYNANCALAHHELGNTDQAIERYEESFKHSTHLGRDWSFARAANYSNCGRLYEQQHQDAEAFDRYRRGLHELGYHKTNEKDWASDHAACANICKNMKEWTGVVNHSEQAFTSNAFCQNLDRYFFAQLGHIEARNELAEIAKLEEKPEVRQRHLDKVQEIYDQIHPHLPPEMQQAFHAACFEDAKQQENKDRHNETAPAQRDLSNFNDPSNTATLKRIDIVGNTFVEIDHQAPENQNLVFENCRTLRNAEDVHSVIFTAADSLPRPLTDTQKAPAAETTAKPERTFYKYHNPDVDLSDLYPSFGDKTKRFTFQLQKGKFNVQELPQQEQHLSPTKERTAQVPVMKTGFSAGMSL